MITWLFKYVDPQEIMTSIQIAETYEAMERPDLFGGDMLGADLVSKCQ